MRLPDRTPSSARCVAPTFLARLSALPTSALSPLRDARLADRCAELRAIDRALSDGARESSDRLHDVIGGTDDQRRRRSLLALRRALFQGEDPSPTAREAIVDLPPELRDQVRARLALIGRRGEARLAWAAAYDAAVVQGRRAVRELAEEPSIANGILLSSEALSASLPRYTRADPRRLTSREEQIERGILRYVTRAAMKATPFSTFCSVVEGTAQTNAFREGLHVEGSSLHPTSHVRLNKALYGALWERLKQRAAVRPRLRLDLNPTLADDGGHWIFLATIGTGEAVQRLSRNAALDLVIDRAKATHGITYDRLTTALADDGRVDASREEAASYLDGLLSAGLLRFRAPAAELEADWAPRLLDVIEGSGDDLAVAVADGLRDLMSGAVRYAPASPTHRGALLRTLRENARALLEAAGVPAGKASELPIYEDATTSARVVLTAPAGAGVATDALARLARLLRPLANPRGEMATMRAFYDVQYPATDDEVPLLRFYEDYYREHHHGHLQLQQLARREPGHERLRGYDLANPLGSPLVRAMIEGRGRLQQAILARWQASPNAEEIEMPWRSIEEAVEGIASPGDTIVSMAAFAQPVAAVGGALRLVVPRGQFLAGFGKYFSRFLHMLPQATTDRVREENAGLAGAAWLAEIVGDASFNGNLHPPVLPKAIRYPTSESTGDPAHLDCTTLVVERAPDDPHALWLVDRPTGTRVLPVDQGFLNAIMRPPLYQLLSQFAPFGGVVLPLPDRLPIAGEPPLVRYRPRIVVEGGLVVARREWSVRAAAACPRQPKETDAEYFLRVNAWREALGVPTEVFVRVRPLPSAPPIAAEGSAAAQHPSPEPDRAPAAGASSNAPRPSKDWAKPQYIAFDSPLLVALFGRLTTGLTNFELRMEERYPDEAALAGWGTRAHALELVLQVHLQPDAVASEAYAAAGTAVA